MGEKNVKGTRIEAQITKTTSVEYRTRIVTTLFWLPNRVINLSDSFCFIMVRVSMHRKP